MLPKAVYDNVDSYINHINMHYVISKVYYLVTKILETLASCIVYNDNSVDKKIWYGENQDVPLPLMVNFIVSNHD